MRLSASRVGSCSPQWPPAYRGHVSRAGACARSHPSCLQPAPPERLRAPARCSEPAIPSEALPAPAALLSSLASPSPVSEILSPAEASWNEVYLAISLYQQLAGWFKSTVKTNARSPEATVSCVLEILTSSSLTNTSSDVTHIHCLLSLTCQRSLSFSFIPRHSSIHSCSLNGRATPLPHLSISPEKNRPSTTAF